MIRKIVKIDRNKCNGCGACVDACHEGAIKMEGGKAMLIKDDYCDGLGDCLPACPADAISITEREAAVYDEQAVLLRMKNKKMELSNKSQSISREISISNSGRLLNWPVQIKLVPLKAPYYENAYLLIAADCTSYAYSNFHKDFIENHVTLIGCPKLDSIDYSEKLTEIIKNNNIKTITVTRMEVPCCGGLEMAVIRAIQNSGKNIEVRVVTITTDGKIV